VRRADADSARQSISQCWTTDAHHRMLVSPDVLAHPDFLQTPIHTHQLSSHCYVALIGANAAIRSSVCLSHLCVCHTPCGPWTTNCLYCLLSPTNVTSSGSATAVQSVTSSARLVDESQACIPALFHFVEMDITLHGQSTVVAGV